MLVGTGGSTFAPSGNHSVTIKEGRLAIAAGSKGTHVNTMFGTVDIPDGSAGILEQKVAGVVRLVNLAGDNITVNVSANGKSKSLSAAIGEELVIAANSVDEEELISTDGVDREPITGAVTVADIGLKSRKSRVDRLMMANKEPLLVCNMGCMTAASKKRWEKVIQSMNGKSAPIAQSTQGRKVSSINRSAAAQNLTSIEPAVLDESVLKPIRFLQSAASSPQNLSIQTLTTKSCSVKHTTSTKVSIESSGILNLKEGEVLIHAAQATVVKSGSSTLSLDPGSVALIRNTAGLLKVVNLYEPKGHSIKAVIGRHALTLASGQEVIVGANDGSVPSELKRDATGRRRIKQVDIAKGSTIMRSEVSLVSLLGRDELLSKLLKSNAPYDRQISKKLIKMAVCVNQVTAGHGAYSTLQP